MPFGRLCVTETASLLVHDISRLFKILSDPTRLRLLRLLAENELSVMELAEVTQLAQSRISNHLKLLREDDLIQERREGAWRFYHVEPARMPEAARALWPSLESGWRHDDSMLADQARLERVLAQRRGPNGKFFETIAGDWDDIRSQLFGDSIAREILRAFIPSDLTLADVGSGTGYLIELFGHRPRKIIAIDNSEAMIAVARRKVAAMGLENVEFRLGDAHEPPLKPGEAGLVAYVMVLHYLDNPAKALQNAVPALARGGRLLIADFTHHQETWLRETMQHKHLGFSRDELERWLRGAGLSIDDWFVLPGRPWTTPEGQKVNIPHGFVAFAHKLKAAK